MTLFGTRTTLSDALRQYQDLFMASRNLAPRTRKEYTHDIEHLIVFLRDNGGVGDPVAVEKKHLEAYLAFLDQRGFSGNTRRRKVASIRSFFAFLEESRIIRFSPAGKLTAPRREYRQPRVLSEAEYRRLRLACAQETRDAAIVELLLQTGIRLAELAHLSLEDIELPARVARDEGSVGNVHILGKGRKDRTVTLNWKVCRALKAYLAVRPEVADGRLFITKFGRGMSPRAIEYILAKYLREAGIPNASVHTIRHTFATHMVRKGTKLDVVRQALGHESLQTTSVYVDLARDVMDRELQMNAL